MLPEFLPDFRDSRLQCYSNLWLYLHSVCTCFFYKVKYSGTELHTVLILISSFVSLCQHQGVLRTLSLSVIFNCYSGTNAEMNIGTTIRESTHGSCSSQQCPGLLLQLRGDYNPVKSSDISSHFPYKLHYFALTNIKPLKPLSYMYSIY